MRVFDEWLAYLRDDPEHPYSARTAELIAEKLDTGKCRNFEAGTEAEAHPNQREIRDEAALMHHAEVLGIEITLGDLQRVRLGLPSTWWWTFDQFLMRRD